LSLDVNTYLHPFLRSLFRFLCDIYIRLCTAVRVFRSVVIYF